MTRPALIALALVALSVAPAGATPDLAALDQARTQTEAQAAATALRDGFGLTSPALTPAAPLPPFALQGSPVVELVDMRLLLAQIAVQTGAKDHLVLAAAQNPGVHQVILLRGGFVDLAGLVDLLAQSAAADFVTDGPEGVTLTRAIVLWPDSGLTLGAGDSLSLSRADGSFLVNLGWLDISGATVRGTEAVNPTEPAFRPFLLTAGRGSLTVTDASFAHLGFGDTQRFGGVSVVGAGLVPPVFPASLHANQFEDVTLVALINTSGATVTANQMTGGAILIAQSTAARVNDNLLTAAPGRAIRVSGASAGVSVSNNVVLGALAGISVDQASTAVTVSGNVLAGTATSGIRLDRADCVQVSGNLALMGQGTGVSLSATGRVAIVGNVIMGNAGSGILLRNQQVAADVRISGNQIAANHEGLRGATAGAITLTGNDMEGQLPRLFAGDLAPRTIAWLEDRRDMGKPQVLKADLTPVCPLGGDI